MGWDAFSSLEWESEWKGMKAEDRPRIKNREARKVFEKAVDKVREEAGRVDGLLRLGGLDCSICGEMLERITGKQAWDEKGWDKELVKRLNKTSKEDNKAEYFSRYYPKWKIRVDELWAYYSAKRFLECCAKLNLSVRFSW